MKMPAAARPFAFVAICAAPVLLAGCSGVTYGTGTSTEVQTLNDVSSILSFGGSKPEIDTTPRGGIVAPPTQAASTLPAPVDPTTTASVTPSDWPNDPDATAKQQKAAQDARPFEEASVRAQRDPGIRLPKSYYDKKDNMTPPNNGNTPKAVTVLEDFQKVKYDKKSLSEAKSERGGSLTADGTPERRYLTEPPTEYREPDPSAPVDPVAPPEKKKSFSLSDLWPF